MQSYFTILLMASEQGDKIKPLIWYFCIAGGFILLLVASLVVYSCIKFRGKPGDPEPKQVTGNRKIEILAVSGSIALLVIVLIMSINVMGNIMPGDKDQEQTPDVIITGHQWWWEASYPRTNVITANEIHLPVRKKLLIELRSADVIHDWSVPAFGPKMDMIPGKPNYLWLTIKKPGVYKGQCNQFCGIEHARMRILVIAQSPDDFQQWLKTNSRPAAQPKGKMAVQGASLFQRKTCANCHRIRGTEANGDVGPDLTHFADRRTILAAMEPNNNKNLENWISHPQRVKPGAHMPDFIFKKDSVKAIVDYLSELK